MVPLTDEQRQQLGTVARNFYHLEPVLVEQVNPGLIGGLGLGGALGGLLGSRRYRSDPRPAAPPAAPQLTAG